MAFCSLPYLVFFPLAALFYFAAPARHRWAVLVALGLVFLAWASPLAAAVAVAMAAVNFAAAIGLERWAETPRASRLLALVLAADVGALGWFKYQGFFADGANAVGAALGHPLGLAPRAVLLPLGISYYTFQVIGYVLEVHWGRESAERHFGAFLASILFFPKIALGPIERPHHFLPQLREGRPFSEGDLVLGLRRVGWGLFKKCVVADRIGLFVDAVYDRPHELTGLPLLLAVALYVPQIYCDFSGYTDIALGSAKVLGIDLAPNFDRPFSATSVTDFWRRWHISLSSWTGDYVHKPLSLAISMGTRWGKAGQVLAILASFFVLGFWHGASWGFVVFGLVHGAAVSVEMLLARPRAPRRIPAWAANALTVVFYAFSCTFFRARTVSDAVYVMGHAFVGLGGLGGFARFQWLEFHAVSLVLLAAVLAAIRLRLGPRPAEALAARPRWARWAADYALVIAIFLFGVFDTTHFVYVQF
jgi:D-alanyl-lipoteichoic acid acyltransferase DltB (MBOAT superfamily)